MIEFVSKTGLAYFYNRIKNLFAGKAEFNTLNDKVETLISEGGEPNTIEIVKVNGTPLTPDAAKSVDVLIPGSTSELINNGDGSSSFATESYVDTNGGKIDIIKINGTSQTITNKTVDIEMPQVIVTKNQNKIIEVAIKNSNNDGLTLAPDEEQESIVKLTYSDNLLAPYNLTTKTFTDANYRTQAQVQEAINDALAGITGIDFQVVNELPTTGVKGVIYLLANNSSISYNSYDEYIWLTPQEGTPYFEKIGSTDIDLTGYWGKEELTAVTTAEIDTIIDG